MIINHNMNAMNAHRLMSGNTGTAGKSMEKLSSGLRINRAGDDAAGLAISEKMRAQIRGLDQAARNSQDGISMIQTAEGALNETHSILQRMRELGTQAANDTNVNVDRTEIQKEINQLTSEINRIGNTTEFNTQKLLDGGSSAAGGSNSSTQATGVAAGAAKFTAYKALSFTNVSNITSARTGNTGDKLSFTIHDVAGTAISFTLSGSQFKTLWDSSQGAVTGATSAMKYEALADILKNNMASTTVWKDGDATTTPAKVKLGDIANIQISEDGVFSIESSVAGSAKTIAISSKGDFNELFGFGATSNTLSTTVTATGTAQVEAKLVGSTTMSSTDSLNYADWAGKSFTVNYNGKTSQITIASDITSVDSKKEKILASTLITELNAALDNTFGAGAVVASIGLNTNDPADTNKHFMFTTDSTKNQTGEGAANADVVNSTKPEISISGDNLDKLLGEFVPGSATSGGTFSAKFQIGANQGQSFQMDIADMRAKALKVSGAAGGVDQGDVTGAKFVSSKDVTNGTTNNGTEYALDVSSHDTATAAVKVINNAIEAVSAQRSSLGAFQNRLEHTIANLGTSSENLSSAESRIRDVDMAKEMMQFSKNNILSQAAQAMLAQANQQPQGVLQLLR